MPCPSNFFLFDQPGNIVLRPETPKLSRCEKEGRCHSDTKSLSALYAMSCGGCLPTLCRKLPATWLFQADRAHNPEFCVLVVVLCGSGNRVIISSLSHRCGLFRWYCCGLVREFFGGKLFNPHCTRTCQNYSIRTTLESVKIIQSVLHRNVSKFVATWWSQSKLRLTVCVGVMWEENALRRMFRPNKEQGRRGVAEMTQSETYDLFAKGCYGTQLVCLG